MKITVAIVCSDDRLIEKCLKSIPPKTSILVVLNFPSEEVLNIVSNDCRVRVLRHDERNLGKLRQIAVDNCETPAICFIDSDCVFSRNAISIIEKDLDSSYVVNIPMNYAYNSFQTKIVSKCRKYTTPVNLLLMPMAFRLDVQLYIGPFFNSNLSWGEDTDQRKRLKEADIEYVVSKCFVLHKPLSFLEDAKSAIRLGRGKFIQETYGLSEKRCLKKDLSIIHEVKSAITCFYVSGIDAALYHFFVWRPSYKFGYWKSRLLGGV